jgi:hypothetical protein
VSVRHLRWDSEWSAEVKINAPAALICITINVTSSTVRHRMVPSVQSAAKFIALSANVAGIFLIIPMMIAITIAFAPPCRLQYSPASHFNKLSFYSAGGLKVTA